MLSGLPKPLRTISEPAAANARAMPRPMPLVEPVTSAVRPANVFLVVKASDLIAMFMAVASCLRANAGFPWLAPWPGRGRTANADWLMAR